MLESIVSFLKSTVTIGFNNPVLPFTAAIPLYILLFVFIFFVLFRFDIHRRRRG